MAKNTQNEVYLENATPNFQLFLHLYYAAFHALSYGLTKHSGTHYLIALNGKKSSEKWGKNG